MKSVVPFEAAQAPQPPPQSQRALRHVTLTPPSDRSPGSMQGMGDSPYLGATVDGRYRVECLLGEGGMGVVYRCKHTIIGKRVAMKILRADLARNDEVVERFLNEARSASSIGNPHIIDISDFGRLPDGATYFVMEYLEGASLSDFLEADRLLPTERIGGIMIQLTEALDAAHRAGIVHRDLKPENIILIQRGSQEDFVKVLDFGIAKATSTGSKLTQAGQVFGTPHYMSPEQAAGMAVDQRADIYAVGVMLYELLTGTLPFDAENFMGILTQHMYKEPPPPSSRQGARGRIAPALEQIVLRCLQKSPGDRYQSMRHLGDDLRALFGEVQRNSIDDLRYSQVGVPPSSPGEGAATGSRRVFFIALGLAGLLGGVFAWSMSTSSARGERTGVATTQAAQKTKAEALPNQLTTVAVAVTPESAMVKRGDELLGTSPVSVPVGSVPVTLEISAPGYETEQLTLDGRQKGVLVQLSARSALPTKPARVARADEKGTDASLENDSPGASESSTQGASSGPAGPKSGLDQLSPSRPAVSARPEGKQKASADLLVDPWGGD